ncbi:MAG: phosphomannose isomerase type II C-terminal cupin domain [Chitinophagales bacterium]|nr:phosphomannose isomerase type II C-terminal cupin domain [Chitinophagales bacterium]
MEIDIRPWGKYEVLLDAPYCKVKRITVLPDKRLSYQMHYKRQEAWTVVQGTAHVTLDDEIIEVSAGNTILIPLQAKHRVANRQQEDLVFVEVQTGTYFGEDDIVRFEDDFNRV